MAIKPLYPAEKYTYRVLWSADDQQHVGVCSEFPDLRHQATTHNSALIGIVALVDRRLKDLRAQLKDPPTPWVSKLIGGRE